MTGYETCMTESQRNLLILIGIAVLGVVFSGAFGLGAGAAMTFLNIAFAVVIIWFLITLYQRNSGTIAAMQPTPRLVLQASGAVLLGVLITGMINVPFLPPPFGWSNWGGSYTLIFWGTVFACGFGIWWAWQQRSTRW